ncbi:hypothetical protein STENM327S_08726 [Streptomyces tendae]
MYADGLMSYGPTREKLPLTLARRIRRLLHLDLIPGLRPMLLSEFGVEPEVVPDVVFRAVLDEISRESGPRPRTGARGADGRAARPVPGGDQRPDRAGGGGLLRGDAWPGRRGPDTALLEARPDGACRRAPAA